MQHSINIDSLTTRYGPQGHAMVTAIESCVHCGFCLPVCPTYMVLGQEMDSPRGRIILMKSVLEEHVALVDALPHIDRCLGCQACVTACPSGVRYGELITPFRAYTRTKRPWRFEKKLSNALTEKTIPYPGRFRNAARLGRVVKPLNRVLPGSLRSMLELLPEEVPQAQPMPTLVITEGKRRARVSLLTGCVQQALAPEINWATLRVLVKNGIEVVIPQSQGCCGGLSIHTGNYSQARNMARKNLKNFPQDVDAILTNAAGCGSGMKEYSLLFESQKDEELATVFAKKTCDVTEFLDELGLVAPPALPQPMRVAYHDACHLAHAQGVTAAPRRLLMSIPNLTLLEIPDGGICCGSAGTYNIEQPVIANELGKRKAENILTTGAEAVALGNIGCLVQIRRHLRAMGKLLPVFHTMELLDMAYTKR